MKTIQDLTDQERQIVFECLNAVAYGPFFSNGLLYTMLGIKESDIEEVILNWPNIDFRTKATTFNIVYECLFNLTFFADGINKNISIDEWHEYISFSYEDVQKLYYKISEQEVPKNQKWDGIIRGTFVGKGKIIWNQLTHEQRNSYLTNVWCKSCSKVTTITHYEGAIDIDDGITIYGYCVDCFEDLELTINKNELNQKFKLKHNKKNPVER